MRQGQRRPWARREDEPTLSEPAQGAKRAAAAEPLPGADSPARWVPGLRAEVPVDSVLPQLGVRDRRQMFNGAAAGSIWVTAAACAFAGPIAPNRAAASVAPATAKKWRRRLLISSDIFDLPRSMARRLRRRNQDRGQHNLTACRPLSEDADLVFRTL